MRRSPAVSSAADRIHRAMTIMGAFMDDPPGSLDNALAELEALAPKIAAMRRERDQLRGEMLRLNGEG